jgi:predicted RNase H-like HicB family nuclease
MLGKQSKVNMLVRYALSDYIKEAIASSEIEQLEDGSYVGKTPNFQVVIAFGDTLLECQAELRSTLADWILVGLKLGHILPIIAGIDLSLECVDGSLDTM